MLFYHGSPIEIKEFNWESTRNEVQQEGHGVYLTTSYNDACRYGKFVYEVTWSPKRLLSDKPKTTMQLSSVITYVLRMIKKAPNWEETAQNWDEEPQEGAQLAAKGFIEYSDSFKDLYLSVSADFYRDSPVEFCQFISRSFDGFLVDKSSSELFFLEEVGVKHAIVFNPSMIKIKKVHLVEQKILKNKALKMCESKKSCSCGCSTKKPLVEVKKPLKERTWSFDKSKVEYAKKELERIIKIGSNQSTNFHGREKALHELRAFEKRFYNIVGDDLVYNRIRQAIAELEGKKDGYITCIKNAIIRMEQINAVPMEESKKSAKVLLEKIDLKLTSNTKRELVKQAKAALDALYSMYDTAEKQAISHDKFLSYVDSAFEDVNSLLIVLVSQNSIEKKD